MDSLPLFISLSLLSVCSAQCPISGCDGLRSFSSAVRHLNATAASAPELLWSSELYRPSGGGCVTNGAGESGRVVCPMAAGQSASLVSWPADGSSRWEVSLKAQAVLPLLSYGGQVVVSDGHTLEWLDRDGHLLHPPVQLFPVRGQLFDLSITLSTSIVTMVYRCGFLSTYTVDGVPIAELFLNDTVSEVEGTFIPLGNPVMNDTRLYILTAFRPATGSLQQHTDNTTHLRLYAIDVHKSLKEKFIIAWTYDTPLDGYIPYIHSEETVCEVGDFNKAGTTFENKATDSIPSHYHSYMKEGDTVPLSPVSWLTMEAGRLLGAVNFATPKGPSQSFNLSVYDSGESYSVISSGYSPDLVSSLSWNDTEFSAGHLEGSAFPSAGGSFWLSSAPPLRNETTLEQLVRLDSGPVGGRVMLSSRLTTPVTLVRPTAQPSPGPSQHSPHLQHSQSQSSALLVFGASGSPSAGSPSGQPHLVGVGVSGRGAGLLWSLPLPHSQPAVGQIATTELPDSSHSLLVVTTPLGVYTYKLAGQF